MHNFERFNLGDMAECTGVIRRLGSSRESVQDLAQAIVDYLYENLVDSEGNKACALIRFFRTRAYGSLSQELQECANKAFQADFCFPTMKCLVLEATRGEKANWNSTRASVHHRAIPLPSEELVRQMPMICRLIEDFGLRISELLADREEIFIGKAEEDYNIFLVADALGSEAIPAQEEFVVPNGIKSVIGFGGTMISGNLFAVILFSKTRVSRDIADMFRCIALATNLAIMKFDETAFPAPPAKRARSKDPIHRAEGQ